MLIGYMRVSTDEDRQVLDLQRDALLAAGVDGVTTGSDIFDVINNLNTATDPFDFYFYIHNPASTTLHKIFNGQIFLKNGGTVSAGGIEAFWNNDTNALTGVELVGGVAIKSGTCSLYGMN